MSKQTMNVGIFGVGYLGKFHVQQLMQMPNINLVGFYDPDNQASAYISKKYQVRRCKTPEELINQSDVLDIVAPTIHHFELAALCARASKHFFIEKPIASTLKEGKKIIELVKESHVKCQVGYIERYNPAYLSVSDLIDSPMFVEGDRLTPFNIRNRNVSVIYDLMIHDIDILLSLIPSTVKKVLSSGARVLSDSIDIANVRIDFHNGCVANLTASRLSVKKMRKMRLFQKNAYISMDFAEQVAEVVSLINQGASAHSQDVTLMPIEGIENKQIAYQKIDNKQPNSNPLRAELRDFFQAIREGRDVRVDAYEGLRSLEIADQILEGIKGV